MLVSIIVITYNSSKYILETLESIKEQTYENIELIISDDLSTDNTLQVVENWKSSNLIRFVDVKIIKTSVNTGISANANRGIKISSGKWIKLIAGDDILLPTAIDSYINYIRNSNEKIDVLLANMINFKLEDSLYYFWYNRISNEVQEMLNSQAQEQFYYFVKGKGLWSVSIFYSKNFFNKTGGYIEKYRWVEDHPFYTKITYLGFKIHFFDKVTVAYRNLPNSLSSRGKMIKVYDFELLKNCITYSLKSKKIFLIINSIWNFFMLKLINLFQKNIKIANFLNRIRVQYSYSNY